MVGTKAKRGGMIANLSGDGEGLTSQELGVMLRNQIIEGRSKFKA
jgi:hypothetical protein